MPERIVYLPLEAYRSRYTEYTACRGGVYESIFTANKIPFLSIRPTEELMDISHGAVLDGVARSLWGFSQTGVLVKMLVKKELDPAKDVIYIEDFWHPGFEQIAYVQSLVFGPDRSKHVPVWAFCHAQSTDPFDFTAPWAWWMRDLERGWLTYLDGVFCAAKEMQDQFINGGLDHNKLHPVGHVWLSTAVEFATTTPRAKFKREPWVVYSSRLDAEKNPRFFLDVAREVLKQRSDVVFKVCTGSPRLRSNDPEALEAIVNTANAYPNNFHVEIGLSKEEYFDILQHASVQFNCASQDFISYTLLEATYYGCAPLYPRYLTFPDALNQAEECLYLPGSVFDAKEKLISLLDNPKPENYDYVWRKYQSSGNRLLHKMGFDVFCPPPIEFFNQMTRQELREFFAEKDKVA